MDPREQFERIQRTLQARGRGLGGGAAGPGGRAFGGLILLAGAGVILSNSLFNGTMDNVLHLRRILIRSSRGWPQSNQIY
jgi:hypothetical protein